MNRRLLWILAVVIAIATPSAVVAQVLIGLANPLTGQYSFSGARNRIAVELAVEDLNRQGGVLGEQVRLIVTDDACGLEQAVSAAKKLIGAGVSLVVGHMCSHSSLLAAGIYEAADVLMISPDSTHPRLTEEGRRNVFRLIGRDDQQGRLAGDFLADNWADERIAILHDDTTYGEGLAAATRGRMREHGVIEVIYDVYKPGAQSYAALVDRLEEARVDVLYVGGYGPDAALILRTARERGEDLQLVGGDALAMDEFWLTAGKAGEGTIFSHRHNVRTIPEAAEVLAAFRARGLGRTPGGIAAYAAVQVWAQAVERAGTIELANVAEQLRRGRFDTALGQVSFDDKGDLEGAVWEWQVWTDGNYWPMNWREARR
jgi:branched-chain amino acid transport system substrate-binding protein